MQTKNGIEFNLKESNYIFKMGDFTFYFSSEFYLNKFKSEVQNFINMETSKMIAKYKVNINLYFYFAMAFYRKIEKRGFYVNYQDKEIEILSFEINLK